MLLLLVLFGLACFFASFGEARGIVPFGVMFLMAFVASCVLWQVFNHWPGWSSHEFVIAFWQMADASALGGMIGYAALRKYVFTQVNRRR
jgi:hypothetical protein